jgi:hypothetical protein
MTVLGFIAALIQALAWPVVILVLALVFRSQVKGLLSLPVQRLKAGPVEVVFGLKLAESETLLPPLAAQTLPAMASIRDELKQLAEVEPGTAVLTAHDRLYERLREMVGKDDAPGPLPATAAAIAKIAGDRGGFTPELVKAIEEVTGLRNLVAHAGADSVTSEQALQYLGVVDRLLYLIRAAPYLSAATAATTLLQPPARAGEPAAGRQVPRSKRNR